MTMTTTTDKLTWELKQDRDLFCQMKHILRQQRKRISVQYYFVLSRLIFIVFEGLESMTHGAHDILKKSSGVLFRDRQTDWEFKWHWVQKCVVKCTFPSIFRSCFCRRSKLQEKQGHRLCNDCDFSVKSCLPVFSSFSVTLSSSSRIPYHFAASPGICMAFSCDGWGSETERKDWELTGILEKKRIGKMGVLIVFQSFSFPCDASEYFLCFSSPPSLEDCLLKRELFWRLHNNKKHQTHPSRNRNPMKSWEEVMCVSVLCISPWDVLQ